MPKKASSKVPSPKKSKTVSPSNTNNPAMDDLSSLAFEYSLLTSAPPINLDDVLNNASMPPPSRDRLESPKLLAKYRTFCDKVLKLLLDLNKAKLADAASIN